MCKPYKWHGASINRSVTRFVCRLAHRSSGFLTNQRSHVTYVLRMVAGSVITTEAYDLCESAMRYDMPGFRYLGREPSLVESILLGTD
jgi:hypothetical protein